MGKLIVFLCFALLAMTLVMGCNPLGMTCSNDNCCEGLQCISFSPPFPWIPPWKNSRCQKPEAWGPWGLGGLWRSRESWGPRGSWGPEETWGPGGPGEKVEWPVKEPTE